MKSRAELALSTPNLSAEDTMRLCTNLRITRAVSVSSCGLHHKARAIAVRRNLRIARKDLAPIHIVVVPRLILIRNEIDAVAALLVAVRLLLKLQGRRIAAFCAADAKWGNPTSGIAASAVTLTLSTSRRESFA
jgi:hypothetical protein